MGRPALVLRTFAPGAPRKCWVQYHHNGALSVNFNADFSFDVTLMRSGERDTGAGNAPVARLILPVNKCFRKRSDDISFGDCASHADVIHPGDPDDKNIPLQAWDNRDYTQWGRRQ